MVGTGRAPGLTDPGRATGLPTGSLVGLGLLGLAARLTYLLVGQRAGLFAELAPDARLHLEVARAIRAGTTAGDAPYLLSPLYPHFLALFPSIGAPAGQLLAVRVVQALFGAVTCALVAALASRLGGRRAGLLAGVVAAVYGPLIHFDTAVLVAPLLSC